MDQHDLLYDKSLPATPGSVSASTDSGLLVNLADSHLDTDIDKVHKAEETPEHVEALPTTVEAPAVGQGDTERPAEPNVQDLGWSEDPKVPIPVLRGMTNEELWVLVRRFNKSIYHVKSVPPPPGILDLKISSEEDFFPDKLRSTIERLYINVIVGVMSVLKHVARIRSWNERNRTASFCIAYFFAWIFNLLMPLLFAVLIALIVHPPTRQTLFPPAPLALISTKGGEKQIPAAGHLGSDDSLTGAAEAYKGQAVEQEASNFVTSFTSIAVGSATGQGAPSATGSAGGDQNETHKAGALADGEIGSSLADPSAVVNGAVNAQGTAEINSEKTDKTKKHVENAMWEQMGPIMHALNLVSDNWERFANALSPTPPFAQNTARLRLAAVVLPIFLLSLILNETVVYKSVSFGIGFGMFGQPIIDRLIQVNVIQWLDQHYPNWRDMLVLENTLLLGVPTNAQLTLTLLRIGEANQAPLPPPPPPGGVELPPTPTTEHPPTDIDSEEDDDATLHHDDGMNTAQKAKKSSRFVGFLKGTAKAGVTSVLGADRIKATVGSEPAKSRLGVVRKTSERPSDGPTIFEARHHGKKGQAVISTNATSPSIAFAQNLESDRKDTKPVFTIGIDDIAEMRKIGGLGWKGKLVVGWATGSEVADGIEIVDRTGRVERLTAMARRDEVFNRILALSKNQHWESR